MVGVVLIQRRKLINPVKVFRRLAWFDFREVMAARTLASLTDSGISLALISRSIKELSQWLPNIEMMVNRLQTVEGFHSMGVRLKDGKFADTKGQLLLEFHRDQPTVETDSQIIDYGKGVFNDLNNKLKVADLLILNASDIPSAAEIDVLECPVPKLSYLLSDLLGKPDIPFF